MNPAAIRMLSQPNIARVILIAMGLFLIVVGALTWAGVLHS
jgi:hypothetical protein